MSQSRGCLKNGLLGCLGLIVILVLVAGGAALMAKRGISNQEVADRNLSPDITAVDITAADIGTAVGGRVVLELRHGEFKIHPAAPGEGLQVEARFDENSYELLETLEREGVDSWVYTVGFRRTISGLQALLQSLMGGNTETYVHVYLPDDVPIDLTALIAQGGCEADLGGLWLTDIDFRFDKGGFALEVSEPLQAPVDSMMIRGHMGGFAAAGLGNASPRYLDVDCSLGGVDMDLSGAWLNDSDIRMQVSMGGISVTVPDDVEVEGTSLRSGGLRETDAEVPVPVLRFDASVKRGEIEYKRR